MGFAVEMYFDPQTEARVRDVWWELARQGVNSYQVDVGARPHVSLAVFLDLDPECLREDMADFARRTPCLPVCLGSVGSFPGGEGVVFLAPVVSAGLLEMHRCYHEGLARLGVRPVPYYLPSEWVPHCTVAMHSPGDQLAKAVQVCRQSKVFGSGWFQEIGLIRFEDPASRTKHLYTFPLQPSA